MSVVPERASELLKASSLFGALPEPVLAELARRCHVARYGKGQVIFQRGDDGDSLMVLLKGRVKISNITADAREIVLNFLGKGDLNGEIAVLDGRERTATATALEPTEALVLQRRDLLPVLRANPDAMLEVVAVLCEKLRAASAIVEENTMPLPARAAFGLLRLAEQHGRVTRDGVLIDLKLSQRDLGNYLGMSRENVNRQIAALREAGHLQAEGALIVVTDMDALRRLADGE